MQIPPKFIALPQDLRRGQDPLLGVGPAARDAGAEEDPLHHALAMQLDEGPRQLIRREGRAPEVAPIAERAIDAVALARGGEERLKQGDALAAGEHGVIDRALQIQISGAARRRLRRIGLLGRLVAGRRAEEAEFL